MTVPSLVGLVADRDVDRSKGRCGPSSQLRPVCAPPGTVSRMQGLAPTHNKSIASSTNAEKPPRDLLEAVERNRTSVKRVLERLRGERDPEDVRGRDWFKAIEYVRDETDAELVLYCEDRHPEAPDSVTVWAIDERGRIQSIGWDEVFGPRRTGRPEPTTWRATEAYETFRRSDPEILHETEAKSRYQTFVDETMARLGTDDVDGQGDREVATDGGQVEETPLPGQQWCPECGRLCSGMESRCRDCKTSLEDDADE